MALPERIKYFRRLREMTQKDFAKRLGVAVTTVSNYENGVRTPSYEQLEAIADILNVYMSDLLGDARKDADGILFRLQKRPELRVLLDVAEGATREDVFRAVSIVQALIDGNKNGKTEGK